MAQLVDDLLLATQLFLTDRAVHHGVVATIGDTVRLNTILFNRIRLLVAQRILEHGFTNRTDLRSRTSSRRTRLMAQRRHQCLTTFFTDLRRGTVCCDTRLVLEYVCNSSTAQFSGTDSAVHDLVMATVGLCPTHGCHFVLTLDRARHMLQLINRVSLSTQHAITDSTTHNQIITALSSTSSLVAILFLCFARSMILLGDGLRLSAQLSITDRAVHHHIVAAFRSTRSFLAVLLDGFGFSVGRELQRLLLTAQFNLTDRAVHHRVVTARLGTSGLNTILLDCRIFGVARGRLILVLVTAMACCTGERSIALCSTSGRSYLFFVTMRNLILIITVKGITANITSISCVASFGTSRKLHRFIVYVAFCIVRNPHTTQFFITCRAVYDFLPTAVILTGLINLILNNDIARSMRLLGDGLRLAADLRTANSTVDDAIIAAFFCTGRIGTILLHSIGRRMALGVNRHGFTA